MDRTARRKRHGFVPKSANIYFNDLMAFEPFNSK